MFEIGFSEIVLIFGLALVVLGPEKLPRLAANIGRWVGRARAMARQFRDQLESEAETLKSSVAEAENSIRSGVGEVNRQFDEADRQMNMALDPHPPGTAPNPPATEPPPDDAPAPDAPTANHTDLGKDERGT